MVLVGLLSGLVKNFNIGIFSDTINVININLFIMVLYIELYLFILLSLTLTIFQYQIVKQLKILCSYPIKLKLCRIVK